MAGWLIAKKSVQLLLQSDDGGILLHDAGAVAYDISVPWCAAGCGPIPLAILRPVYSLILLAQPQLSLALFATWAVAPVTITATFLCLCCQHFRGAVSISTGPAACMAQFGYTLPGLHYLAWFQLSMLVCKSHVGLQISGTVVAVPCPTGSFVVYLGCCPVPAFLWGVYL